MIYLLFGEMGVGKNYVGERLAQELGCKFFDGDLAMPLNMKERVRKFRHLPNDMITSFVNNNLVPAIKNKLATDNLTFGKNLVVAQALYKAEHRDIIKNSFISIKPVYIKPPSLRVHMARIMTRPSGFRWAAYCLASKPFFQKPDSNTFCIVNNVDYHIKIRIGQLLRGRR